MSLSLRRLNDPVFRSALNRLCWIDPFDNAGVWDVGWSCREHAWFTALLARSLGYEAVVMHGKACFTPRFPKSASVFFAILQDRHAWVGVDGFGLIDLSIKPVGMLQKPSGEAVDYGDPFPLQPVFGTEALGSRTTIVWDQGAFDQQVTRATQDRSRSSAIYLGLQYDRLLPQIITEAASWVNSPLTDRLKAVFEPTFYLKALLYLHAVASSKSPPLPGTGLDLWKSIDTRYESANAQEALRLVRLDSVNSSDDR